MAGDSSDPTERFIAAAVRPLENDAELKFHAETILRDQIAAARPSIRADSLETAASRLEQVTPQRPWKSWRVIFSLFALPALAAALIIGRPDLALMRNFQRYGVPGGYHVYLSNFDKLPLPQGNSPSERLLLEGTPRKPLHDRFEGLWLSEPRNAAFFAEYAAQYVDFRQTLPPRFLEIAAEIDPGNGWFPFFAAAVESQGCVSRHTNRGDAEAGIAPTWTVRDPARLQRALELLHRAAQMPRFTSYDREMREMRIPLLPRPVDFTAQLSRTATFESFPFHLIPRDGSIDSLIAAQASRPEMDASALRLLSEDWESIARGMLRDASDPLSCLVADRIIRAPAPNFRDAFRALGMEADAGRFDRIVQSTGARSARLSIAPTGTIRQHAGSLTSASFAGSLRIFNQTPPSPGELKPGRLAEHAPIERLMGIALIVLLGSAIFASAIRLACANSLLRRISSRMTDLLRPGDGLRIVALGSLCPLLYSAVILRLLPSGSRDWATFFWRTGPVPALELLALGGLLLLSPILAASHRLNRRGAAVGLEIKPTLWYWSAIGGFGVALPLADRWLEHDSQSESVWTILSLLGIALLAALIGPIRTRRVNRPARYRSLAVCQATMPAYGVSMLLLAAMLPLLRWEEKEWTRRDLLGGFHEGESAFGVQLTEKIREDVLNLLAP